MRGTKSVSEWTAMVTSIATAAGITNFTVSDMFVSTHALGGNNDASAAKNLYPWTGNRFGCAGWIAFCVTLARVNDAVAEAQTAAEIR